MTCWPAHSSSSAPDAPRIACGAPAGRPILMGMTSDLVFEALVASEIDIELGGCCMADCGRFSRYTVPGEPLASSLTEAR